MGYSVTTEVWARIERNRAAGRLCKGPTRSPAGCQTSASCVLVLTPEDGSKTRELTMCARHAASVRAGGVIGSTITEVREF